jgi:16S rRNA (adenine1518-N6/adenine1519-N6)-dimethyltransferase
VLSLGDEVRQFCIRNHLRLNTDLGQHFLIDQSALDQIVEAAELVPGERVVEIGPGIGVLTRELLRQKTKVTAVELDDRFVPLVKYFTKEYDGLTVIQGNALKVDLPKEPYKMVANIPYHITSPLFRHAFLESPVPPTSMTLLIQREVAEKICSKTDSGVLTVIVNLFGTPRIVTHVRPESFLPPPKVDSSVLHVDCFEKPKASVDDIAEILKLTKIGFAQKRKMLRNSIGGMPGGMERMERANIEPTRRPQNLTIEEWIALARARS